MMTFWSVFADFDAGLSEGLVRFGADCDISVSSVDLRFYGFEPAFDICVDRLFKVLSVMFWVGNRQCGFGRFCCVL